MPTSKKPPSAPPPGVAPRKRKFTIQELRSIDAALKAFPATNNPALIERVMDLLNDPGTTIPPRS